MEKQENVEPSPVSCRTFTTLS